MTIAEILRKAAMRIAAYRERFACLAIDHIERKRRCDPGPAGRWFRNCPVRPPYLPQWTQIRCNDGCWWNADQRQERIIGLLLAAEIAESEGL